MQTQLTLQQRREIGTASRMIYGQFLEHFHRQVYGGVWEPGSPLADADGFRKDVLDAMRAIHVPVIRWPGGCFVSAYHWVGGVTNPRRPYYDKAWRVEESNEFGTDEYVALCRKIGAEPYICSNAGTGTAEETSDWVEYCNLDHEGPWAKLRRANGHEKPYGVKYWSIGNENYGGWEMGAKTEAEWGRFVAETAKMMKRVDPTVELFAASIFDLSWNVNLLKEAGRYLDWISVHGYYGGTDRNNRYNGYERSMAQSLIPDRQLAHTRGILEATGYLGKLKIAFDEWNLKGWYHPNIMDGYATDPKDYILPRNGNDINSLYTMADAAFTGVFLNACLRNCDTVGMANFSPVVNTRGMIFTHKEGIVLRPSYYTFLLYTNYLQDIVVDGYLEQDAGFTAMNVAREPVETFVPALDTVATRSADGKTLAIGVVNRDPENAQSLKIDLGRDEAYAAGKLYWIQADDKDAYNDIERPDRVGIASKELSACRDYLTVEIPPHTVAVVELKNEAHVPASEIDQCLSVAVVD